MSKNTRYESIYTVIPPKDENDQERWVKIGVMFPLHNGGHRIVLEALPLDLFAKNPVLLTKPPKDKGNDRDRSDHE